MVYLVSEDFAYAAHISQQIIHFGYFVQQVRNIQGLSNAVAEQSPVAVIIDIPSQGDDRIFREVAEYQRATDNLIFTSDQDDQVIRLKSIRAGGAAFFTKPINIVHLIDKLDSLNRNTSDPTLFQSVDHRGPTLGCQLLPDGAEDVRDGRPDRPQPGQRP